MSAVGLEPPTYHRELIDGREIQKPVPKKLHTFIQVFLIQWLSNNLPRGYRIASELNVLTGHQTEQGRREYVVPDVMIVRHAAEYQDGDLAEPPLLAVEILSPGQTIGDLFVRADRILRLGCPMVWVIWPEKRQAWTYSPDALIESLGLLVANLPGENIPIGISLAELWTALD